MSFLKSMSAGFGGCLGVGFAILFVGGCVVAVGGKGARDAAARRNAGGGSGAAPTEGFASMEKFNKIQPGMPHHQVVNILGSPGEVTAENVFCAGSQFETATAIYTWRADNGIANMNVTMQNAHVVSKAQLGL